MKDYADLHTHTIASGHAYGTITEMVHAAALKDLPILGITEHARGTEEYLLPVTTHTGLQVMSINLILENETEPVVWRGPVIAGVVTQFWTDVLWTDVDYMFVDMPPGTGDVPLTVFQSLPLDGIIIVSTPQDLVAMIVEKAANMAQMMQIPVLGLVENMSYAVCPDCGRKIDVFGESHIEEISEKFGYPLLGRIPLDRKLSALCDRGMIELMENDYLDEAADKLEYACPAGENA